ncbi:helix-turn-helix domain-containing protein [Psychromonas hadalis]|uniref:helix-turn-helix domain-containing protein n=1 Tax=Psychromonas hadalis TaxID=211669 RepID=UPI000A07829A
MPHPHSSNLLARQSIWQTPRETEVINGCTAGKSDWETCQIMERSERTVKFHMKNICQKLDALNKFQAIAWQ